jgi:hypothetical protein
VPPIKPNAAYEPLKRHYDDKHVDVGQGLSPFKRSFLGFREIGAVSPSGQAIETFV